MALTFTALCSVIGTHTKVFEGQTASLPIAFADSEEITDGITIDKSDLIWIDQDRILNATTENIDLSGALTDVFGDTVAFAKVNGIYIHNKMTTAAQDLKVGGAAVNAFLLFDNATDIRSVGPDGKLVIVEPSLAGITVTPGTGDILKLNAGAVVNLKFDIIIWGRSA